MSRDRFSFVEVVSHAFSITRNNSFVESRTEMRADLTLGGRGGKV